jgi:hypothetical protein
MSTDAKISYYDKQVSFFRSMLEKKQTEAVSIRDIAEAIRDGKHAACVKIVRDAVKDCLADGLDDEAMKKVLKPLKDKLPCWTLSGVVETGPKKEAMQEGRFLHSGTMQVDIDHKDLQGCQPGEVRDVIGEDKHMILAALSPSRGVKGIMLGPICKNVKEHKRFFAAVEEHMLQSYELKIDENTSDPVRICYVTHDPAVVFNAEAVPMTWDDIERLEADAAIREEAARAAQGERPPVAPPASSVTPDDNFTLLGTVDDIRHVLHAIPNKRKRDEWLKISAAVKDALGSEESAIAMLEEWCPGYNSGEYEKAFRNPLSRITKGSLVSIAQDYGFDSKAFARQVGERGGPSPRLRGPWDKQEAPGADPKIQTLNGKPAIELPCPGRPLSDFAAEVGRLLAGRGVYSRGGMAFTVDLATKQLCPVDPQWLRTWAEGEVALFKQAKTSAGLAITLRHSMSLDVARALIVSPQFLTPLPEIKRFAPVRMPVMRPDGRIELLPDGFDAETLTLTDPNGCQYQTDIAPELGAKAIRGALSEFPFADERSKAAAVSAMLTIYAGGLLPPASTNPAFIYLANAEGSGKTTLAQLAGIPYGVCEAESKPATEEEWQKALLALVMGGGRLLLLDNLKGHLNSPSFEAYLTATKFSGRILGVNKKFSGEADAVVLLTGNRLTVSPDLRRRCIFVELFMEELRAEDRVFKRRLDAPAILEMQPGLLSALWCMVKGWDAAGRPPASKINASIPRWSETIAGIVEWAGFACPSVPAELEDGGDTDTRDIAKLGGHMTPGEEMKFSTLCDLCAALGCFERFTDDLSDDGTDGLKARKGLSAVLKTFSGRMIAPGKRFCGEGKGHQRRYVIR